MSCITKIVVFDMDETLGYFIELGMFWDSLCEYLKKNNINISINQDLFNKILDLYPEFLRPNIISILEYLKSKKQKKHCEKLMIYTNNQGPEEWSHYIKNYFDDKLKFKIFDQVIAAFKVKGKRVELCRTTHMKTLKDFTKCTKVPESTQICFLDDVYYPGMSRDNIYYINIKPYIHDISFEEMINRFLKSNILNEEIIDNVMCKEFILNYMKKFHYNYIKKTDIAQNVDKALSKKIMHHLELFFNKNNGNMNKTKRKKTYKIKTLKKRTV